MLSHDDEEGYITEEYLQWVVDTYGPKQLIRNTNCAGNPTRAGDYAFVYGEAGVLLERTQQGEKIRWR